MASDEAFDPGLILDEPAPHAPEELFFSRTDGRGVIRSGNTVFQRISRYDWDALLGAPHKLIRHPHMPRAVFRLLWTTIKSGRPIGAYVKNRARDGRFYWVFAIVTPIEDGYLSVRIKPCGALLPVVDREYANLRRRELEERLTPEESASLLVERLAALGYRNYPAFMAAALTEEITARDRTVGRPPDEAAARFRALLDEVEALRTEAAGVMAAFEAIRHAPTNMRVQTSRLGSAAAAVGVVAQNYTTLAQEAAVDLRDFLHSTDQVERAIDEGLFLTGVAHVQTEVAKLFGAERDLPARIDEAAEIARLESQRAAYVGKAQRALRDMESTARRFGEACARIRRLVAAMEVTRVLCRIEGARLQSKADGLQETIDDLGRFRAAVAPRLDRLGRSAASIRTAAGSG